MIDREKVIKGLEYHLKELSVGKTCFECPYYGDNPCEIQLIADAIAMLKEQDARVMKLDELKEIYVEFKGGICPVRLTNFDLPKIIMYAVDGNCRLWAGKPTDEQRKAVKWE